MISQFVPQKVRPASVIACCVTLVTAPWVFGCDWGGKKPLTIHDGDRLQVTDVIKGDEVVVGRGEQSNRVRLLGIFAFTQGGSPDPVTDFERAATTFLRTKVMGKTVLVKLGKEPKDPHGRYLAYLSINDTDINRQLIRDGLVLAYTEFDIERENDYLAAETQARAERLRIWSKPELLPVIRRLRQEWAQSRWETVKTRPNDPLLVTSK